MKTVIGIDAGHGGSVKGATRPWFDLTEADYNVALSRELRRAIVESRLPFEPHLLRVQSDQTMTLRERGDRSKELGCKLVVHLHVNAAKDSDLHGGQLFCWPGNNRTYSMGCVIARSLPGRLYKRYWSCFEATDLPGMDDDWLERPRDVMRYHPMDTLLLEVGFMSNPADAIVLQHDPIKAGLVIAVLNGLADYWRTAP